MRERVLNGLGWASGIVAAAAVFAACLYGVVAKLPAGSLAGEELWTLAWVGFPITGAVIAGRRSDMRIGWLLIGTGAAIAAGRLGAVYAHTTGARELTTATHVAWFLWGFELVGFFLLGAALLHFPTDRLPSRRWRWPIRILTACAVAWVLTSPLAPEMQLDDGTALTNPRAIPVIGWIANWVAPVIVAGMMGILANLVWRAIRSGGLMRQQLKWLAYAASTFLVVIGAVVLAGALGAESGWAMAAVIAAWVVCFNAVAAAIGVAVLRYRLYDIDRVASRTATYLLVTLTLLVAYVGGVVVLGSVARALSGAESNDLVVAASTLAVAALFGPVRRRIQSVVDRRFNRAAYDAARTVETFSHRLRDELDLDAIAAELRATAAATVQPARSGVWIRGG